ncbi:MAG: MarR family transcriptional regulator [Actinomycetota bacterium]|nr:MarR family transcriptional regulator [Actinomycetota bacterium]
MSNRSKKELIEEITDRLRVMQVTTDLFDDAAAARLGVNRTDLRLLDVLERLGPLTPSRLAELNDLSRPAMTTAIDRLERAGYARRVPDLTDRRRLLVEIDPRARRRAMEIYGPFADCSQTEFARYTGQELDVIDRFLAHAIELTRAQLARIRPGPRPDGAGTGMEQAP